jgi:hypothetical protein
MSRAARLWRAKKGGDAALAPALKQFTEAELQATELAFTDR